MNDILMLMLSARGEEYDKLFGFEMGVDDSLGRSVFVDGKKRNI